MKPSNGIKVEYKSKNESRLTKVDGVAGQLTLSRVKFACDICIITK
jgi:hypothetical protein